MTDRRRSQSLERSAALALAAAVMLVPAYLLPVLNVRSSAGNHANTIFSGIVELCRQGLWVIGGIVFVASILVPLLKLLSLGWLLLAAKRGAGPHARDLTRLYARLHFIGRWSMLDVFLVAFLAGAVQFGSLGTIEPRPGIIAFAAVVILTLLATRSFDPRLLLWDGPEEPAGPPPSP